jgi:Tol biopolymer transport system component
VNAALKVYEPYWPYYPSWSPDGTQIAFDLTLYTGTKPGATIRDGGAIVVMSGEGRHVRRIADNDNLTFGQWSPDGSKIAVERVNEKTDRAVLVILDLERVTRG